ncbi:MAG: hypothetical protein GWP91_00185 [Rhodobacterales bacterium]|nr:hypothetical protein [Rhodobacterales bacterium]
MFLGARKRYRPLLTLLLVVVWLFGGVFGQLHHVIEAHEVCAEHGVLEHDVSADDDVASDDEDLADTEEHGERCQDDLTPTVVHKLPELVVSVAPVDSPTVVHSLTDGFSTRGPPLSFAPKTSPPRIA